MKKLAITEEREEEKYDHLTSVKCWTCDPQSGAELPDAPKDPKVRIFIFASSVITENLPIRSLGKIPHRRNNAIYVICTPIGSQSMGRRDKPM
jgi:hypothetical protein